MTKPVANIAVQIRRLEEARARAKELPRGTVLTAEPMAELLKMSWVALRRWTREIEGFAASGAFVGGGNGVNYEFKPLKTIDFLLRHFRRAQSAAAAKQTQVRKILGGSALAGVSPEFSLAELDKMIGMSIKLQEQLQRQGKLVDADKVRGAVTTMCSSIQQAAMRGAMEQDVTGQWPAEIREAFENAMRNVLASIERAARDCLKALGPSG